MALQVDLRLEELAGARASAYVGFVKPAVDRVLAAVLLTVLAPLLGVIWLGVRVTLGAPVIFRQERVGVGGGDFTILKFRTMRHDRRARTAPIEFADRRVTHKTADDPRHTRLGMFLRATSLDELPQLVNVLRGEMSLVGPRPEISEIADRYGFRYHPRHSLRPGITGLWQVSAHRNALLHENLGDDLVYLEKVSLRTDMVVLALTVEDVFKRCGG